MPKFKKREKSAFLVVGFEMGEFILKDTLKYCLYEMDCEKKGVNLREPENAPVASPFAAAHINGEWYISAAKEILPDINAMLYGGQDIFSKESLDKIARLCSCWGEKHGLKLIEAPSLINCYEIKKEKYTPLYAERLTGEEENILFSDLPYLVSIGKVFGIKAEGKVVSLCGAVDRGPVVEAHIETAPSYRNRGFAKDSLKALTADCEKPLLYRCREKNSASNHTALSAGGTLLCRTVIFYLRK